MYQQSHVEDIPNLYSDHSSMSHHVRVERMIIHSSSDEYVAAVKTLIDHADVTSNSVKSSARLSIRCWSA